jgi:hypothetical protein
LPAPTTVPFYDLATGKQPPLPYRLSFGYLQVPTSTTSAPSAIELLHDATIQGCRFLGVTVPVLVMAQLGTIRAENNTVQDCYAGLWLISLANSAQRVAFDLLPAGDSAIRTELNAVGLGVLSDGTLVLALGIARVLPSTPPTGAHLAGRVVAPIDQQTVTLAAQGLQTLLTQAVSQLPTSVLDTAGQAPATGQAPPPPQPAAGPAGAATVQFPAQPAPGAPTPTPAQPTPPRSPASTPATAQASASPAERLINLLPNLNSILTNLGASPAPAVPVATDTGTTPVLRLSLGGNEIDAVVPSSYSGPGLLVVDTTSTHGSALLIGNRIRNRFPDGQTAVIAVAADAAALNGNIIANEANTAAGTTTGTCSLYFQETAATGRGVTPPVAITGNVFITSPIVLPTALQQRWLTLNAVVI